jgi:AbrB family looped-hinge helix DNA binding protein
VVRNAIDLPYPQRDALRKDKAMKEILSTITSKGQVTIPKDVRDQLGLKTHDKIAFVIEGDGTVHLRVPRFPTVASLVGIAGTLERPVSWDEMRRIGREDALAKKATGATGESSQP